MKTLTDAQKRLYLSLWIQVKKAAPQTDRAALTVQALGHGKSSKLFTTADLNLFRKACLAIINPTDLDAQLEDDEEKQLRFALRRYAAALDADDAWLLAIARRMASQGKFKCWQRDFADLPLFVLKKLIVAVKVEAKCKWPDKDALFRALYTWWNDLDIAAEDAEASAKTVLKRDPVPPTRDWTYEDFLAVLGHEKQRTLQAA